MKKKKKSQIGNKVSPQMIGKGWLYLAALINTTWHKGNIEAFHPNAPGSNLGMVSDLCRLDEKECLIKKSSLVR